MTFPNPFTLSVGSRVFVKCVLVTLGPLPCQGLGVLPCLDDLLLCRSFWQQVTRQTELLIAHLEALELKVNHEKNHFSPAHAM